MTEVSYDANDLPVSTLAVALLFAVNAGVLIALKITAKMDPNTRDIEPIDSKRIPPLAMNLHSVMALCQELSVFGAILGFTWICENRPVFPHQQKEHVPDFFWFICLMILLFALGSLKHDPKCNDLVNRDQTEEWKGWMQTVFLLYHYFHAEEVYNSVRVMISCYVWMTGFGNFSFFYIKRDFGFVRFAQMMWRLNFSVLFLCLTMNNMYMLYYICPLHTFYFVLVFVVMRVYNSVNHSEWGIRVKLAVAGIVIFMIWEFSPVFDFFFGMIPNDPHPGAAVGAYGIKYEWHFRSGLDHYSTYFGMIFALNFPQMTLWISRVESLPAVQEYGIKIACGLVFFGLFAWWATEILPLPKLIFNVTNPYFFYIPLLAYIFFRNATPWLRQVHLGLLATIGKYTLETYLMQHHIWLTSNAKTVLVAIPNYPKINLVVVTAIYFAVARRLYRVTMVTRAMLVPDNTKLVLYNLGYFGLVLGGAGIVAWVIQFVRGGWLIFLIAVGVFSFFTFAFLKRKFTQTATAVDEPALPWSVYAILGMGAFAAVFGLLVLPTLAPTGAPINGGPLRPTSEVFNKQNCIQYVGQGRWKSGDKKNPCSVDSANSMCIRESWAWTNLLALKACHYEEFSTEKASALFDNRRVAFVGDESMYDFATAVHRIADPSKGHDVLGHVDRKISFSGVIHPETSGSISFFGAQGAEGVLKVLEEKEGSLSSADLVVVGAWVADSASTSNVGTWNRVASRLSGKECALVLPPSVVDSVVPGMSTTNSTANALRTQMMKSKLFTMCHISVDMTQLTWDRQMDTMDGFRYSRVTNQVASQVFLNSWKIASPPPVTKQSGAKKGSGGGVAQDTMYGAMALCVAFLMLGTMDNFAGVAFLITSILAPSSPKITWEESVRVLHQKIGVAAKQSPVVKEHAEEEEGVRFLKEPNSAA